MRSPNDVWKELCKIEQKNGQNVDQYLIVFGRLWSLWCEALTLEVPPEMIKRDQFVVDLEPNLRLKVELKNLDSFKEAIRVAQEKEWKVKHLR